MAVTLALLEGAVTFVAVCGIVLCTGGQKAHWLGPGGTASRALALALCTAAAAVLLAASYPFARSTIAQGPLLSSALAALVLVLAGRAGAYRLIESPRGLQRVLVVGGGPLAQELIAEMQARPDRGQRLVGLVEDGSAAAPPRCPRLGSLSALGRVVEEVRPHRVIVALGLRRGRTPYKALLDLRLRGILVEDGVDACERLTGKVAIEALTPSSIIFSQQFRAGRLDLALARILMLPVAAASLILLAPLCGVIALAIKLDSPGPVFFIQERVGRGGKRFRLIKFRTMRPAQGVTSEWVKDNDRRLTRVGRCLRRFRLDELPQLLNVLKGDMNLVGPRPHPVSNLPLFVTVMRNTPECGEPIPYYTLRSLVRPGLTGWAQVRYHYANDLEEEIEKMRYDLYYIKHRSAWLDLRILFATFKIVLRGHSAPSGWAATRRPGAATPPALPALRLAADESRPVALTPVPREPLAAEAEFDRSPAQRPMALGRPVAGP